MCVREESMCSEPHSRCPNTNKRSRHQLVVHHRPMQDHWWCVQFSKSRRHGFLRSACLATFLGAVRRGVLTTDQSCLLGNYDCWFFLSSTEGTSFLTVNLKDSYPVYKLCRTGCGERAIGSTLGFDFSPVVNGGEVSI